MKKILIDTNVIIDFLLEETNYENAQNVIEEISNGNVRGYITASMATDIFYLLQKKIGKNFALNALTNLLKIIDILTVCRDDVYAALNSGWNDFEDALQAQVAVSNGMDAIITRNIKDYKMAKNINIILPNDFNNYYKQYK